MELLTASGHVMDMIGGNRDISQVFRDGSGKAKAYFESRLENNVKGNKRGLHN